MELDYRAAVRAALDDLYATPPEPPAHGASLRVPVPGVLGAEAVASFMFGPTSSPGTEPIHLSLTFLWLGKEQRMPWPGALPRRDLEPRVRDEIAQAFAAFLADRILYTVSHLGAALARGGATPDEAGQAVADAVLAAPARDVHGQ